MPYGPWAVLPSIGLSYRDSSNGPSRNSQISVIVDKDSKFTLYLTISIFSKKIKKFETIFLDIEVYIEDLYILYIEVSK